MLVFQNIEKACSTQRRKRILFSTPVMLHHLTGGKLRSSRGISLDISEAGIGALIEGQLHVGDTVGLELRLSGLPLSAVAIVRHTSSARSGFEFLGLTPEERARLAALVGTA